MISVNVDMSDATQEEREAFFSLPHVGGAFDSIAMLSNESVELRLQDVIDGEAVSDVYVDVTHQN